MTDVRKPPIGYYVAEIQCDRCKRERPVERETAPMPERIDP